MTLLLTTPTAPGKSLIAPMPRRCLLRAVADEKPANTRDFLPWAKNSKQSGEPQLFRGRKGVSSENSSEQVGRQKRKQRVKTRKRNASATAYIEQERLAFFDEERSKPNYGGFGKAHLHWYALWVTTKSEEEAGKDIAANISRLGTVEDSNGTSVAREVDIWVPTRTALKWSNRYKKMQEIRVKYGDGNWLFVKFIMDNQVYNLLQLTPVFRGFRPESCVELRDKFETIHVFPKPLTEEFMASVRDWTQEPPVVDETSKELQEMNINHPDADEELEAVPQISIHTRISRINSEQGFVSKRS